MSGFFIAMQRPISAILAITNYSYAGAADAFLVVCLHAVTRYVSRDIPKTEMCTPKSDAVVSLGGRHG